MKSTVNLGVFCFLASVLLLGLGCDPRDTTTEAAAVQRKSWPSDDQAINHFWFNYSGQPTPGKRVWMRLSDNIWAELYPNGAVSRYKRTGRANLNGQGGTVVQKIEGDPRASWTPNDGSFEAFIPDRASTNRVFYFRHVKPGAPMPWRALAPITSVEESME